MSEDDDNPDETSEKGSEHRGLIFERVKNSDFNQQWLKSILRGQDDLNQNIEEKIRADEADSRNKIGLAIVKTFCRSILIVVLFTMIYMGYLIWKNSGPTSIDSLTQMLAAIGELLKDLLAPIVLVALGYFFGSNNSART